MSEVTRGQVLWPILGIRALHLLPIQVHTHSRTHTRSSGQPVLQRPGSSWGFGALLKGLTSVVVLKVKIEERWLFTPPTDNSCRTWDSNQDLRVTSPTLYPLGHNCPKCAPFSPQTLDNDRTKYLLNNHSGCEWKHRELSSFPDPLFSKLTLSDCEEEERIISPREKDEQRKKKTNSLGKLNHN